MALKKKTKAKAPTPQGSDKKGESDGLMHGLLTVLLSLLIVFVVFGGAFYYVLRNNLYGLGEQFRPGLERIPVIKLALPPLPETEDPDDPKHLTQKELIERYNAYRNDYAALKAQLEEVQKQILTLEDERSQWNTSLEETEAQKLHVEGILEQIQTESAKLKEEKEEFSRIVAEQDPEIFIEFFEKIDKETAERLYQELITDEVVDQKLKATSKTLEEMDAKKAASILTEMSNDDRELLIDIIRVMKPDAAAEIIENMEAGFAAALMCDVSDKILKK